jgi:nitrous oxidase accessory protein
MAKKILDITVNSKFILAFLFLLLILSLNANANDIQVGNNKKFSRIKDAVNYAKNGDRIFVDRGTYKEGQLIIEKSIELIGIGLPVLDGYFKEEIITIKASNVRIKGFLIKNSGKAYMRDVAGIKVENSNNVVLEYNVLEDNFFSIYLANSRGSKILSNKISGKSSSESFSGNGIHLWNCNNILIEGNETYGQRDGIYLEFVKNSKIINNLSRNNLRYGLHFMFSEGNSYVRNTFRNNGAGVAVMYTYHVEMIDNIFEDNWGNNSYGLLLKDIGRSLIKGNTFSKNTVGIYVEASSNLIIKENGFISNGWGMKILGNCIEDTIINNNFLNNTFDVSTNASRTVNFFDSNYWDKYTGYDLDNNNIGDVPYRPVSLFSMVVERTPEAMLLLRSFLVDLLDLSERVMPVFISENLIDNNPKMKIIGYDTN